MNHLTSLIKMLWTPSAPTSYTSPHTGQTFQYGKCYDAAGNMLEEVVDAQPLVGEIMLFAGTFVPRGFLACDGSLQNTSANSALYSVIGTTYGGSSSSFALPDLRGRIPIGAGQGSGLSNRAAGQKSGSQTVAVTAANLPSSTKTNAPLIKNRGIGTVASGFETGRIDGAKTVNVAGSGQGYDNMPPFLALQYCIAVQGVFPPRS